MLDREPLFPVGEGFHYSDTSYFLIGMIIEKASRSTYFNELARRLLVPLDLDQTTPLDQRVIAGIVQGHAPESERLFGLPDKVVADGVLLFDPSLEWTGGGLVTTSEDMVRWAVALFSGKVIRQQQVDRMLNSITRPDYFADAPDRRYGYGLGINVVHTSLGVAYRHGGFFPGYNSMLAYFPDAGITIAMQVNTDRSNIQEHLEAIASIVISKTSCDRSNVVGRR